MVSSKDTQEYFDFSAHIEEFIGEYSARPFRRNWGGMGLNHSFAVFAMLREIKPTLVVESGVWRGHSTWLISRAVPQAQIVALDPRPDFREVNVEGTIYLTDDFAGVDWTRFDATNSICFFDDHVSALARLMEMKWAGFSKAIFEDNYPAGEGDFYSVRQIMAGVGHPRIQMSRGFELRGRERRMRAREEEILEKNYWRQYLIRHANQSDSALLKRNLVRYVEAPPLYLGDSSRRKSARISMGEGSPEPLILDGQMFPELAGDLSRFGDVELRQELSYGHIAYVEI